MMHFLNMMYLYNNNLTGSIPSSLINLDHKFLTGGIPEELGLLDQLQIFVVKGNSLQGSVLASLLNLSALVVVDFSHDRLEGALVAKNSSVDQEFLPNLRVLSFASNCWMEPL
ncbi:hypothetical protein O6H91_Y138000 [Diphasiastrum complanatum]|nr:hypothetical protein O6H91_Y138000 [Diphasiastrum complanatum]